jgi:hypothetical protein
MIRNTETHTMVYPKVSGLSLVLYTWNTSRVIYCYCYCYHHHHHHHHVLSQVSISLVFLYLNQWSTPPLRLQFSDCGASLFMCDLPSTAVIRTGTI